MLHDKYLDTLMGQLRLTFNTKYTSIYNTYIFLLRLIPKISTTVIKIIEMLPGIHMAALIKSSSDNALLNIPLIEVPKY